MNIKLLQILEWNTATELAHTETGDKVFQAGTGHHVRFVKCWQIFLELNSKRLCRSSGKEKESSRRVFTSSRRRETKHFHVVVVQ